MIRPLLGVSREQTAEHCRRRGLSWCEDASNHDPLYARARVREGPDPGAEVDPSRRRGQHRPHRRAAARRGRRTRRRRGGGRWRAPGTIDARPSGRPAAGAGAPGLPAPGRGRRRPPGAGRAPATGGDPRAAARRQRQPGPGWGAARGGRVRSPALRAGGRPPPLPAGRGCASRARAGAVRRSRGRCTPGSGAPTPRACWPRKRWSRRCWCAAGASGDRMAPLGLGGSRSLQDLFTDRRVPREQRTAHAGGGVGRGGGVGAGSGHRRAISSHRAHPRAIHLSAEPAS